MNLNTGGWASPLLRLVARLRSDGLNSTRPVTEINGGTISATNADIAIVAKGNGATLAQVPDGTVAGGDKRGQYATDLQKLRTGNSQVASGNYAVIGGGETNTASSVWSCIAGGAINLASGTGSFVGGGLQNTASAQYACVGGGTLNNALGSRSTVGGGDNNTANSSYSCIPGGSLGTTRSIQGYFVFPACIAPIDFIPGVSQSGLLVLGRQTTDATPTVLRSNTSSSASSVNQVTLPNNSAYYFRGSVIANVTAGGNTKAWTFEGAIKRGATAATTTIVDTVVLNVIAQDAGAAAWSVAITADTTIGSIAVTVTGAAATTIRWVAKIETTEVTY